MNRQFITILGAFMLMASTVVNAQDQRDPGFLSDDEYPTSIPCKKENSNYFCRFRRFIINLYI
jgi:hypothetical protein